MKAADKLAARLGANIDESMGARRAGGSTGAIAGLAPPAAPQPEDRYSGSTRVKGALCIALERITPDPNQPRKHFDQGELVELAASLRTRGQLQPIRVRWDDGLRMWVIVTGERRWRAARLAGLADLACIEQREARSEADLLEDQLVENCLRADLTPLEQAHAFRALIDARNCSVRQLAESLSISHQSIIRALRLLGLADDLQEEVAQGNLAPSVATELAEVPALDEQRALARKIKDEKLNRDHAVEAIRQSRARGESAPRAKATRSGKTRKARPVFFCVDGGMIVQVSGPFSTSRHLEPESVVQALRAALGQAELLLEIGLGAA